MTQARLAAATGLSRSYLCDMERGRGTRPSVETVERLASALGIPVHDLIETAYRVPESGNGEALAELERIRETIAALQESVKRLESLLIWSQ